MSHVSRPPSVRSRASVIRIEAAWVMALVVGTLAPAPAHAEGAARIALHWTRGAGAESCASGAEIAAQVEQHLGHPVFLEPATAELSVEAVVFAPEAGGFAAHLRLLSPDGEEHGARQLASRAADCDELSETAVLVLAIMVDPEAAAAAADQPVPEPSKPASQQSDPEAPPALTNPAAAPAPKPPATKNTLAALSRVNLNTLPDFAAGFGAEYQRRLAHGLALRVEAVAFLEREILLRDRSAGTTLQLALAGVGLCPPVVERGSLGLALCATFQGGALLHRSTGLRDVDNGMLLLLQARVGVRWFWQNDVLRVGVGVAGVVPFVRHQLDIHTDAGERVQLFNQGTVSADFDASVGVRF